MRDKSIFVLAMAVLLFGSGARSFATLASFQGLGDLPGGLGETLATDVSADGSVVVGCSFFDSSAASEPTMAFRWTSSTGMVYLGDLPDGRDDHSEALGISGDGSVVVGWSYSGSGWEAFRWTSSTGMVGLGDFDGGYFVSEAWGASADGSVIVGRGHAPSKGGGAVGQEAFRWTSSTGMVSLGDLPGETYESFAYDVSPDGSVVVGCSISDNSGAWPNAEAFRWEDLNGNGVVDPDEKLENHPEFGLGDLSGGIFNSHAYGVSGDGSVVVGLGTSDLGWEAFRWTSSGGMAGLGDLPGGDSNSVAYDVSYDGSVVVGVGSSGLGYEAFIWDTTNGLRNVKDVLVNDLGLDLTGWTLAYAHGISDDGLTIVGMGTNPSGNDEAWIATVPEPATILLLGLGGLALLRKHRSEKRKAKSAKP